MLLKGQTAIVTGASRGIGAACAILLARNGAAVGVNYLGNKEAADHVVGRIREEHGKAVAVQADVRDQHQVERMVKAVEKDLGHVDILVNNANINFPVKPFVKFSWEDMASKLNGEIGAAFHCCHAVLPGMVERGRGRIINISSGLSRTPGDGFVAHTTAKSGLDAFTKALAHELGPHGITVNTVAPGLTETDATAWLPQEAKDGAAAHTPMRRIGQSEDVAGAVLFFASHYSSFITGTWLPVDGGNSMF
ncbi:MAG: 3-oxoacyl-ACP reductase FabG [bacterium]|nr:MAG: 3-oxoacyl-ACP reductase FabG [bacterium]